MPRLAENKIQFNVTVNKEIKKQFDELCRKECRRRNDQAEIIIEEWIKKQTEKNKTGQAV